MSDDVKQVKVDNWGIYFLQRLKHFFNRTDYCDLTLQFQDNAQLKVHRLVLSACTEYFELLERTCEMYEDCLVMPEDLQADIVVPIVNFMYTGQLEFKMDILDKLHQCSEIMNMPVLTKLLDSHRPKPKTTKSYGVAKRAPLHLESAKETIKSVSATEVVTTTPVTYKRSHNKAFDKTTVYRDKKIYLPINKPSLVNNGGRAYREPSPIPLDQRFNKKVISSDPRPTRYELPEELDSENIFESSFCNISYTSQPLMVHPETRKQYSKRPRLADEASSSSSKKSNSTTVDIVECKKPTKSREESLFEDSTPDDTELFPEQFLNVKAESSRDPNQLFDQMLEGNDETKVTIETKNNKSTANLDHAKIISEVLKKYPHLVKSNKNIKLKILNTCSKNVKKQKLSPETSYDKAIKTEKDYTFETDVLDSKHAARLIAMGAENIDGPWICLICGTPGKAMNFTSYYKFRRHLVEVHNEKPVLNICEHCGHKSAKRNYLMHHLYTKHGVVPPPQYHFPKCNLCTYIALTEALLIKHKASHFESKNFRCNVCPSAFHSSTQLLLHIQNTGHKYSADRKSNLQCIYCQKGFMREGNLCAHLKTYHRNDAIRDGIIDDFDDDANEERKNVVKSEPSSNDFEEVDIQYQIQQRPDGNITVVTRKSSDPTTSTKQKILNADLSSQDLTHKNKVAKTSLNTQNEYMHEEQMSTSNDSNQEIVVIDNTEYIMRDNQLIPRRSKLVSEEYILSDRGLESVTPSTSMEFTNIHNANVEENIQHSNILLKNPENLNQSIPIYVSNEEEYKAIMASNQPIIFDSGDSTKTLTVLTAPHASTLETTTIDLDTTQSNDMMIIQDEYPLNVSEAVVSENSNIVVVYSHQVGDQNKQYQLLTTQGLGAQFVQSSSIITQNYESVTTTAPVMNAHVLGKQVVNWQNNLQQIVDNDQIEITPIPNLQSDVEQTDQVQIKNNVESNNNISDLPRVELSNVTETTDSNMNAAPVSECQDMVTEEVSTENLNEITEEECIDNAQIIASIEVVEEGPIEESQDFTVSTDNGVENVTDAEVSKSNPVVEETELIASQTYTQPEHTESQTYKHPEQTESQTYTQAEHNIESQPEPNTEIIIESMEVIEQPQSKETTKECETTIEVENIQINNEAEPVFSPNNVSDISINADQILTEDVAEKVQILTSEWSEEDTQEKLEDNPGETALQEDNGAKINDKQDRMETCEVEESIENIQQEIDKQVTVSTLEAEQENEDEISDVANSSQEELDVQENPVTMVTDPAVAQQNISSLLNDWDDNDSQEGNDSVAENVSIEPDADKSVPLEATETENPEKQDKIKSLVSDWDEDEEENKN